MAAQATHIASHLTDTEYSDAAMSLLHDATLLQARNTAVPGGSLGDLISSVKTAVGKDSPPFTLFPVSGGGRSGNHPRYALVWASASVSGAQAVQNSRKRMRKDLAEDTSGKKDRSANKPKELAWIMHVITDHEKNTRHGTGVKLAPPPPGHRTTSILKPVVAKEPILEPEAQHFFSPLDYQTAIGNASVVHNIYLEARRTTRPRTRAEELSRRKRALQMAYKEILGVINDIEWHRKGSGFKSGPQPSVLVGLEQVPDENRRPWLLEKLDVLKKRQCEARCAIEENEEAPRHLIAVMDAVLITLRAGADGIVL